MSAQRRPPDVDDEFLTVAEVAAILKLNQQTIRNWIDQGSLAALRSIVGRPSRAGPAPRPRPADRRRRGGVTRGRADHARRGRREGGVARRPAVLGRRIALRCTTLDNPVYDHRPGKNPASNQFSDPATHSLCLPFRGQEAVRGSQVQPTFRLASRLRNRWGLLWMGACGRFGISRLSRDVRQLRGRGAQIHLGPPESRGSGGAVPRPMKGGFPRPKLETAYLPRLRRSSCRRRTLCLRAPRYRRRSAAAVVVFRCYPGGRHGQRRRGPLRSGPCPAPSCSPIPG
jgi:excisionase family DNA binding protein